jgi:hypothetical protein
MLKAIKEFFTGKKSEHPQPELSAPVPYKVEAPVTAESAKAETVIAPVAAADVPISIEAVVATPVAKVATSVPAKKTAAPKKPAPAKKPAVPAITSTPKTSKKKK